MSGAGTASREALPPHADTLGYAGLLPFALLTAALWVVGDSAVAGRLQLALLAYGATILAFLGAVHWGVALRRPPPRAAAVLAAGVLPQLVGAGSLLLSPERALVVQMIAIGLFWLYEHRVLGEAWLPRAYLDLRRNLTLGVLGILLFALLGPVSRLAGTP